MTNLNEMELQEVMNILKPDDRVYVNAWNQGADHVRQQVVKNLMIDSLVTTNVDVYILERIVNIIEHTR